MKLTRQERKRRRRESSYRWIERNPEKYRRIQKSAVLRRQYGLSLEAWEALLQVQNGKCALCKVAASRLYVDHDHVTGRVRGLLCIHCNLGLGHFKDNREVIAATLAYLN